MTHIMLDIETFGTSTDSYIRSIGAISFNPSTNNNRQEFHEFINTEQDRKIDANTVMWWLGQSKEAQDKLIKEKGYDLRTVLLHFSGFCKTIESDPNKLFIWGNGNMFDNTILRDAMGKLDIEYPCSFRNDFDLRTLKHVYTSQGGKLPKFETGVAHDALDDCKYQIRVVREIYRLLGGKND